MGHKMRIIKAVLLTAIFIMIWVVLALNGDVKADEVITQLELTTDSDDNNSLLLIGRYNKDFNGWKYGINGGVLSLSEPGDSVNLNKTQATFKRLGKGLQINGHVNHYINNNWSTFGGAINVSRKLGKKGYGSISAEKNIVDSVNAIDSKITFTSIGVAGDYNTSFYSTSIRGAYSTQNFSDGNVKDTTKLKVIVPIRYGLRAEALLKIKDASFNPKQYFSPKHLQDELVGISYRKTYSSKWYVDSKFMVGTQQIGTAAKSPEMTFKVLVRGNITKRTQVQFLYDLLDIGGDFPYRWELYNVKLTYSF